MFVDVRIALENSVSLKQMCGMKGYNRLSQLEDRFIYSAFFLP